MMNKRNCTISLLFFLFFSAYAQNDTLPARVNDTLPTNVPDTAVRNNKAIIPQNRTATAASKHASVYHFNPAVDIPVIAVGTGWSLYAFTQIYKKGSSTEQEILNLKTSSINSIDRPAVRPYDHYLDSVSYFPFYASMPLPFVFFLFGERTRSDFLSLSVLYWETMSVTGLFGTGSTYFVDRYRPYTYSPETPMDKRMAENAKNSFYAGHVEVVATSTFFISEVYSDYYPQSNLKWMFFGLATAATGSMAYLRYQAGMHFPSDIALGITMGAAAGILVPHFHKNSLVKNKGLSVLPYRNGSATGLTLIYKR